MAGGASGFQALLRSLGGNKFRRPRAAVSTDDEQHHQLPSPTRSFRFFKGQHDIPSPTSTLSRIDLSAEYASSSFSSKAASSSSFSSERIGDGTPPATPSRLGGGPPSSRTTPPKQQQHHRHQHMHRRTVTPPSPRSPASPRTYVRAPSGRSLTSCVCAEDLEAFIAEDHLGTLSRQSSMSRDDWKHAYASTVLQSPTVSPTQSKSSRSLASWGSGSPHFGQARSRKLETDLEDMMETMETAMAEQSGRSIGQAAGSAGAAVVGAAGLTPIEDEERLTLSCLSRSGSVESQNELACIMSIIKEQVRNRVPSTKNTKLLRSRRHAH